MRKLVFLIVVALVLSSVSSCSSTPDSHPQIYNFRDYEWGTPLSVVLEKEGDTPHKRPTKNSGLETSTIAYPIEDFTIEVAGHKCDMELEFYKDCLVTASYWFQRGRHGSESRNDLYNDLSNKLTMLYGKPKISDNGKASQWNNIFLRYLDANLVWLYYVGPEQIIQMGIIQKNNTTGL